MTKTLADYTPLQQQFLKRAADEGIEPDDELATSRTVGSLERAGLIHKRTSKKGRTLWRTTDTGRGLVTAHVPKLLMHAGKQAIRYKTLPPAGSKKHGRHTIDDDREDELADRGYTHKPWRAMRNEPETA